MKKLFALLLTVLMVLSLAACGSSQDPGGSDPADDAPKTIAEDTDAINLRFTPPEGYETVNRYIEKTADGTLVDKTLTYKFADGAEVLVGNTKGKQITDEIPQSYLDDAEIAEYAGKSFYIVTSGKTLMGIAQDGDVVYGIGWTFAEETDRAAFDALMGSLSLTDNTGTAENGDELFNIRYTPDASLPLVKTTNSMTETPAGETVDKAITYYYGTDADNLDYRITVKVFKNSTVEQEKSSSYTEDTLELGGVAYTVLYENENSEKPFAYYTQQGGDVYLIRDLGVSDGWSVTRSEESYAALETLMNTVSFVSAGEDA